MAIRDEIEAEIKRRDDDRADARFAKGQADNPGMGAAERAKLRKRIDRPEAREWNRGRLRDAAEKDLILDAIDALRQRLDAAGL